MINATIQGRIKIRQVQKVRRAPLRNAGQPISDGLDKTQHGGSLAAFVALVGLAIPSELQFYIAGAKFTPGRVGVILLLIPAVVQFVQRGGRALSSDVFAFATACWMIAANIQTSGFDSVSSTLAESLEFVGGYFVARGLFFGPAALHSFVRVLKAFVVLCVLLAIADSISGRYIAHEAAATIVHTWTLPVDSRGSFIRAAATFDHAILFGVFCSLAAAVLLYSGIPRRRFYVGLCLLGCFLSQSSAALISSFIVLGTYTYGRLMKQYQWRWSALWCVVALLLGAMLLAADHPLDWAINHLTLDPSTGWWRKLIWDAALDKISLSPLTGYGFSLLNDEVLDNTVDSAWLVYSLRFGVPMIALLFLANVTALLPGRKLAAREDELYMADMRTAFSTVLVLFMFLGLTVHFWNYMWIFWGICIGIRASLREY